MKIAELDFPLKDYELAAYQLSKKFIDLSYYTEVIQEGELFTTLIYHKSNLLSQEKIAVSFYENNKKCCIMIKTIFFEDTKIGVARGTLETVTILPSSIKGIRSLVLKNKVRKEALKIAFKLRKEAL